MRYQPSDIIPREELPEGRDYALANSFKNFVYKAWVEEFGFGEPTPVIYEMADFLQYGGTRIQLLCFRGASKSWITCLFCAWLLYRDVTLQVTTVSATEKFAGSNARFVWSMIQSFSWLACLRPRPGQAQSAQDFDVRGARPAKGTSFASRGIFGQLTGLRSDVNINDDTETPNTSGTPGAREDLRKVTSEIPGAILKPGGINLFLGTAQCEETIYLENEDKGYRTLIIPVLYPTPEEIAAYGRHRLARFILQDLQDNPGLAGTSVEPLRFTEADIAQRRLEWGEMEFRRQFKMFMDGGDDGRAPVQLRNIPVLDLQPYKQGVGGTGLPQSLTPATAADPSLDLVGMDVQVDAMGNDRELFAPREIGPFQGPDAVAMHIDPSGDGLDETAWCITALMSGRIYLLAMGASLDGYSADVLRLIAQDCAKWSVQRIFVESNLGLGMFGELLKPLLKEYRVGATVEGVKAGRMFKEQRIVAALQPITEAKRLVVNLDVFRKDFGSVQYDRAPENKRRFYRFSYQLTRIREIKDCLSRDDRVDCLAAAVSYWSERMAEGEQEAEQAKKDEFLRQQLQKSFERNPAWAQSLYSELETNTGLDRAGRFAGKRDHRADPRRANAR